ncbi:MAG: galactose-1-phosphate uridylyltransferase [bacterium]
MTELRYNPLEDRYVMVAGHRQHRPQMPSQGCPFCPGSGKVPEDYRVLAYPNDFPALSVPPRETTQKDHGLYRALPARGYCEVILYSPDHHGSIARLPDEHLLDLFRLWRERYEFFGKKDEVRYVLIFENKGDVIGVTMPHPHGQLYAFPFIPPRLANEILHAKEFSDRTGKNLYNAIRNQEIEDKARIVFQQEGFVAFVPFFADFPYETHIHPSNSEQSLLDFDERSGLSLMRAIQLMVRTYDNLFGFEMPFMMSLHQKPTDGHEHRSFRFYVKFTPIHRSSDNIKYCATCETVGNAHCNPSYPEQRATELRSALEKLKEK